MSEIILEQMARRSMAALGISPGQDPIGRQIEALLLSGASVDALAILVAEMAGRIAKLERRTTLDPAVFDGRNGPA